MAEMSEWQPIETAPTRGPVLVAYWVGEHKEQPVVAIGYRYGEIWLNENDEPFGWHYTPTHWQPLPAPPKAADRPD